MKTIEEKSNDYMSTIFVAETDNLGATHRKESIYCWCARGSKTQGVSFRSSSKIRIPVTVCL